MPRENYHLTLAFVGEIDDSQLQAMRRLGNAQRMARLALQIDTYEYWPKPEVIVAAVRHIPDDLEKIWRALHEELAACQLSLQPKSLRPHVTLARNVSQAPVLPAMSGFEWCASSFSLVRSDLGTMRSVYTVLDTWPLLYDSSNP